MLNPELKLNDGELPQIPARKGFGEGLVLAGKADKRVVGICADLSESTQMHLFKEKFPDRFIEVGVAEQNLVTVASGMAAMGKVPFVSSYAVFSPGRNWEQIRTTICFNDRPVKIVGTHTGVNVGPDGGTHQALEDIALMRVLPRMTVISPCDAIEARKAAIAVAKTDGPVYVRLPRDKSAVITTDETPFEIGKAKIFWKPASGKADVGVIATGTMVHTAILAAAKLEKQGKRAIVMNLSTIKPLDEQAILDLAHETRAIVTAEEHQMSGGMGSAVSECLSKHFPTPMEFVGVDDSFGQSGTPEELVKHYRLDEESILSAIHKVLLRKK